MESGALGQPTKHRISHIGDGPLEGPWGRAARAADGAAGLGLTAILLLAAILRFYGLPGRGLIYWDEAKYALEGIRLDAIVHHALGFGGSISAGKAVGSARPTHDLLIALAYCIAGVHVEASLVVNATASLLQILVLYRLAVSRFGRRIALLSALFLAVSDYDVVYARSALPESDGNLILLIGILIWTRVWAAAPGGTSSGRHYWPALVVTGLLFGVAFTANFRLIVYCAVVISMDLVRVWQQQRGRRALVEHALLWLASWSAAPLLWQLVGIIAQSHGIEIFRQDVTGSRSYVAQALYDLHQGRGGLHITVLPYLDWFVTRQGWVMSGLVVAGIVTVIRERSPAWVAGVALVLGPMVIYIFAPFGLPRSLDATIPFTCLLAARGLVTLATRVNPPRLAPIMVVSVALILAGFNSMQTWQLTTIRSGFPLAARYIERSRDGDALTSTEIMVYYLGAQSRDCEVPAIPHTLADLSESIHAGYTFAVLDGRNISPTTRFIQAHARLVAQFSTLGSSAIGEDLISTENTHPPGANPHGEWVDVYWLGNLHLPPPDGDPAASCSRDRVI